MLSLSREPILTKYVITRDLPSGFFGPTFIVHPKDTYNEFENQDPINDPEALVCKVVHKSFLGPRSRLSGFLERIRLLSELNLPFVEPFLDIMETDEDLYLFRRFIPFGNLTDFSKQNPKGVRNNTIFHIWRLLATCLIEIHQNKICPSSLKPNNIFVVSDNTLLITDLFELTTDISLTIQTPDPFQLGFMAPEYFDRSAELSSYSDIWSLGMIIVFLKTGGLPWQTKNLISMTKMITSPNPYLLIKLSNSESESQKETESDVTHLIRSILVHEAHLRPPAEALLDIQKIRAMSQLRKNVMQNPHFNSLSHLNVSMSERSNYGMGDNSHTKILMQVPSPKRPFMQPELSVPIRTTKRSDSLFEKYSAPPLSEHQHIPTQQSTPTSFTIRCRFLSPSKSARPVSLPSQPPLMVNQYPTHPIPVAVHPSPSQAINQSFLDSPPSNIHGSIPLPNSATSSPPSSKKPPIDPNSD